MARKHDPLSSPLGTAHGSSPGASNALADQSPRNSTGAFEIMSEFLMRTRKASDLETISACLAESARKLGFDHFALAHHGDIAAPAAGLVFLHDYPEHWAHMFADRSLHRIDPVQHAASIARHGFAWDELPALLPLSGEQKRMLVDARGAGLVQGYTVPVLASGELRASCSFVRSATAEMSSAVMTAAECLAHLAWSAAIRTVRPGPNPRPKMLSPRQRDCVVLMAMGKTDWEIGHILGLAENTVTAYLNHARTRFGVARRTQLALAALYAGEIGIAEIRSWQ